MNDSPIKTLVESRESAWDGFDGSQTGDPWNRSHKKTFEAGWNARNFEIAELLGVGVTEVESKINECLSIQYEKEIEQMKRGEKCSSCGHSASMHPENNGFVISCCGCEAYSKEK